MLKQCTVGCKTNNTCWHTNSFSQAVELLNKLLHEGTMGDIGVVLAVDDVRVHQGHIQQAKGEPVVPVLRDDGHFHGSGLIQLQPIKAVCATHPIIVLNSCHGATHALATKLAICKESSPISMSRER